MKFDISTAKNFLKLQKGKFYISPFFKVVNYLSILLIIIGLIYLISSVSAYSKPVMFDFVLGLFALALPIPFLERFFMWYYTPQPDINSENIAEGLSRDMMQVVSESYDFARKNNFQVVEPIVLLAMYERNQDGKYMLLRCGFGIEKDVSAMITDAVARIARSQNGGEPTISPQFLEVMLSAKENAISNGRTEISSGDILMGLILKSDVFGQIMFEIKMEQEDVKRVVEWHERIKEYIKKQNLPFWEREVIGGVGRDWSFGYTPTLSQFARNLNMEVEFAGHINVYGRSAEIDEIERVLAKFSQNNVLLIGDPGIGKKTIVKGFVERLIKDKSLPALKYMQVFQVDTGALLSGSSQSGEISLRIKSIFNETVRAGNIILFFDNFHSLVSKKEGVGQVDTSAILLPYLNGSIKVIGATNLDDFHKSVEANPGILGAFNKVSVHETNLIETIEVLEEVAPHIEHRDNVFWPYQSLREVVRVADRYIQRKPFPQKAIEIMDEVSVEVSRSGGKIVFARNIDELVSKKLEVPVAQAEGEEAKKLLGLEEFLHQRVIGQDEAIKAVSNAMRRARAGVQSKQRPIGVFLFLGPTGVGKTETSKALAESYFGSEKNMIRIDMSEYQEQSSIYRLIGSPPAAGAEGEKGQLTTAVVDNPFSLILLDEIEKAHKDILSLFLQVFDDGRLTDGTGKIIDFTNSIIISTSNAGSELIRERVAEGKTGDVLKTELLNYLQTSSIFRPEFLNRFDEVVSFHPLSKEQIVQVAQLMLRGLAKRMLDKEISVEFTDAAINKLAEIGFDPTYGARPMRRAIQDKVENLLANKLLSGEVNRGAKVLIDEADIV